MKLIAGLTIVTATLFVAVQWASVLADPNDATAIRPIKPDTEPSAKPAKFAKLSSRNALQRIANETGGLYRLNKNPSAKDYQQFLDDIFNKPIMNDRAKEK